MIQGNLFAVSPRVETIREFENLTALHLPTVATSVALEKAWDDATFDSFLDFVEDKIVRVYNHHAGFRQQMIEDQAPRHLRKWFEHWADGKFQRRLGDAGPAPDTIERFIRPAAVSRAAEMPAATPAARILYRICVGGVPWNEYDESPELRQRRIRAKVSMVAVSHDRAKHEERAAWLEANLPDEFVEIDEL